MQVWQSYHLLDDFGKSLIKVFVVHDAVYSGNIWQITLKRTTSLYYMYSCITNLLKPMCIPFLLCFSKCLLPRFKDGIHSVNFGQRCSFVVGGGGCDTKLLVFESIIDALQFC